MGEEITNGQRFSPIISTTSTVEGKVFNIKLNLSTEIIDVRVNGQRVVTGPIAIFKENVAKLESKVLREIYNEILSLMERVEDIMTKGNSHEKRNV
jgi:hypothetical protein